LFYFNFLAACNTHIFIKDRIIKINFFSILDVTTTTSSLSDSSGNSNQSPQFTLMSNDSSSNQNEIIRSGMADAKSEASTPA